MPGTSLCRNAAWRAVTSGSTPAIRGTVERRAGLRSYAIAERPQGREIEERLRQQERGAGVHLPPQQLRLALEVGRRRGDRGAGEERGGLADRRAAPVAALVEDRW